MDLRAKIKGKKITDLPKIKRPRERLFALGADNLTHIELLAIIISSGSSGQNALDLAHNLLKRNPLKNLACVKLADLTKIKGIGTAQACKIIAALELGKRIYSDDPISQVITPQDVLREVSEIRQKDREYLLALYLNARHVLLKKQTLTIGNLNQNIIEVRDVFAPALSLPCAFIILIHNHPSGDPKASVEDVLFTKKIKEAGELIGIKLIDHLIVSKKDYFSFLESGQLENPKEH